MFGWVKRKSSAGGAGIFCGVFYICVFCNRMVRGSGLFVKRVVPMPGSRFGEVVRKERGSFVLALPRARSSMEMIVDQDHQGRIISEHANSNLFKPSNQAEANALDNDDDDVL